MRGWLGEAHDRLYVAKLQVARDRDRLNQKLVPALGIRRRVLLHGLQEDYGYRTSARYLTFDMPDKLWVGDEPVTSTS